MIIISVFQRYIHQRRGEYVTDKTNLTNNDISNLIPLIDEDHHPNNSYNINYFTIKSFSDVIAMFLKFP